jgi:hypothetical protein
MSIKVAAQKVMEVAAPSGSAIIPGENIVYLMGLSFIIGSLFTIFILLVLDFMRRNRSAK